VIYHLVYLSEKDPLFYEEGMVGSIIDRSKTNNKIKEITGILINNGRFFIQLLEGDTKNVHEIYNKIIMDKRHINVTILIEFTDNERIFPDWNMGLTNITTKDEEDTAKLIRQSRRDLRGPESEKFRIINLLKKFNNRNST
jgi:hypothetical protein